MGLKVKLLPSRLRLPLCTQQPKTASFRVTAPNDDIFKTINSVYVQPESDSIETPHSWFTYASESDSMSITTEYDESSTSICGDTHLESIVREAQRSSLSDQRFFFDPTMEGSRSPALSPRIDYDKPGGLDVRNLNNNVVPLQESVAVSMESENPYEDFKKSMEEMVESLGVGGDDWERLEELLSWYLQVNGRHNYGYIISAFGDLLAGILCIDTAAGNTQHDDIASSSTYFSSADSCLSSCGSTLDHRTS